MGIAIPVLSGILRAAGIRRLRRIMRGYRILRDSGRQALIGNIKRAMTIHPIDIGSGACRPLLFGAGTGAAELICRQLLLTRLAGLSLNRAVLHSLGRGGVPVNHALPAEWRTIMRDHGVPVASIRSFLLWHAFVWMMIGYGLLQMVRIVLRGMRTTCRGQAAPLGNRHVYFHALGKGHLPQPCRDGRSHDILTWYTQWDGRILEIDALCHDVVGIARGSVGQVPVVPVDGPVPALKGWASLGRFIGWGLMATTVAVWDHLRGRWWHAALLGQAAQAAQMRLQEPGAGAGDYLFHNSGWFNRPLWTYEAASSGSRIIFYFYSTNCELFERPGIPTPLNYGWQAMDWPHYLVWDDHQADFVRAAAGEGARTAIVGPIWFQTSAVELPALPPGSIAVFDVQPVRSSFYETLGLEFDYYVPETAIAFLTDISTALGGASRPMCLKRKREVGRLAHVRYRHALDELDAAGAIVTIKPEVSAIRLIEACAAVISMPFTSTALLGRSLGKPSCYYDPTGMVIKDDKAAHGIPVISGRTELAAWLNSL